jgi:transcription initiation factor TFIIE subunit alpha
VYKIDKDMQGTAIPANERKEYFCSLCKAEWTQMEVLDNVSPAGFLCHRCGRLLTHDLERNSVGHQKSTRMNNQFKFITGLLPQIDSIVIPDVTFDVAFANARPVVRKDTHLAVSSVVVETGLNRPTAVKGLANTGPKSMQVSISTADGPTEEEKAAERARKERIAKQNVLPSWMSSSTITGESFSGTATSAPGGLAMTKEEGDVRDPVAKKSLDAKDHADIDDYFARLKAEQAAEASRRAAEQDEYGSDDEDEEDFEDVVETSTGSAGATPASTAGMAVTSAPVVPSPLRQSSVPRPGNLKRDASASGSSTGATSPATVTPASDGRSAKKVKLEPPPAVDDGEDEDGVEFENV